MCVCVCDALFSLCQRMMCFSVFVCLLVVLLLCFVLPPPFLKSKKKAVLTLCTCSSDSWIGWPIHLSLSSLFLLPIFTINHHMLSLSLIWWWCSHTITKANFQKKTKKDIRNWRRKKQKRSALCGAKRTFFPLLLSLPPVTVKECSCRCMAASGGY